RRWVRRAGLGALPATMTAGGAAARGPACRADEPAKLEEGLPVMSAGRVMRVAVVVLVAQALAIGCGGDEELAPPAPSHEAGEQEVVGAPENVRATTDLADRVRVT